MTSEMSAKECRYENTGVNVESTVPPVIWEINCLQLQHRHDNTDPVTCRHIYVFCMLALVL